MRKWHDLSVSVATIERTRKELEWVCTRPHYCQLLRPVIFMFCKIAYIYALRGTHVIFCYCLLANYAMEPSTLLSRQVFLCSLNKNSSVRSCCINRVYIFFEFTAKQKEKIDMVSGDDKV